MNHIDFEEEFYKSVEKEDRKIRKNGRMKSAKKANGFKKKNANKAKKQRFKVDLSGIV